MIEIKIYFGGSTNKGSKVFEVEFHDFCKTEIFKYYDSFTISSGAGIWKESWEGCWIVTIITKDPNYKIHIAEICNNYNKEMKQDSTLATFTPIDGQLYGKEN